MADETNKSINELIKIEEERLALQKKQLDETAEDRKERVDKKAVGALTAELKKNKNLMKDLSKASDGKVEELLKGPVAKIAKNSKKNVEVQTAIFNLSAHTQKMAAVRVAAQQKFEKNEKSFRGRSARILSTLAGSFLENTHAGQALALQLVGRSEATANLVEGIEKRRLTSAGALKAEFSKFGDGFGAIKTRIGELQDKVKGFFKFFIDPRQFIKITASAFSNVIFKPLGRLLFFLIKLLPKGIDKLIGVLRGTSGSKLRLKQVEDKREKVRDQRARDRRDTKESGRLSKLLGFLRRGGGIGGLLAASGGIVTGVVKGIGGSILAGASGAAGLIGLKKTAALIAGKKTTTTAATRAGGPLARKIAADAATKVAQTGRFARLAQSPGAKVGGRILGKAGAPLVAAGIGLVTTVKETKKTGSLREGAGEGLVAAADFLTLGLVNKNELREKIRQPFIDLFSVVTEEFSTESVAKTFSGISRIIAAPFLVAFKAGFNIPGTLGTFGEAFSKVRNVGLGAKATLFQQDLKETLDSINRSTSIEALKTAIKAFKDVQETEKLQISSLLNENARQAVLAQARQTQLKLVQARQKLQELQAKQKLLKAQNETLTDLMLQPEVTTGADLARRVGDNATLRERAKAPVVITQTAPTIVQGGDSTPAVIPLTTANRNNENMLQRVAFNNFRGASP